MSIAAVMTGHPDQVIKLMNAPVKNNTSRASVEMGKRINAMRTASNLSQAEIAAQMELSDAAISMWEKGKTQPSIDKFIALAKILHTTPEYLAFGVMYTNRR